jgi:arabinogalactan endo-1,4-beta-galactosidase
LVGNASAAPPTVPTVVNPGFDADNNGVANPTGWSARGDVNASYTEWGGRTQWRLTHWSPNAYNVDTFQTLNNVPEGWYTASVWGRRSNGNNNTYLSLQCGNEVENTYVPVAWSGQWVQMVASVRAHGNDSCTIDLHSDADAGEWVNFDDVAFTPGRTRLAIAGADVSSLNKSVAFGGQYFDEDGDVDRARKDGEKHDFGDREITNALTILKQHGVDYIRLRVWVNPADGYHNKHEILKMGRLADAVGLKLLVDFHYSDTWADPGTQTKPAAWASYTVPQLAKAVYDFTYSVCDGLADQGTPAAMVQIGNEINSGMLFPDGSTWNPPNWNNLAEFINAGASAAKAAHRETKVMLHLANGWDNGGSRWWFDNITALGVPFDVIGFSFYNYWGPNGGIASLGDLQYNLGDISARYNKDVVVVETAYPFTLNDADGFPNSIGWPSQLVAGYPATTAGQAANLRDVIAVVRSVPNGHGLGVFYWDATWTAVPGNGWDPTNPASGDSWENQALFDFNDRALPAMSELHRHR